MKILSSIALAAACLLPVSLSGQNITVTATLTDGQGIVQKTAYLHWQLWNCGNNVPMIQGSNAIVAQQFDMRANPSTGVISGSVYGNDQILCGNIYSTQWIVTQFKASGQPGGQPQYYCLTGDTTFDPSVTQPCQIVPPPPGYILQFDNPIQSQTLTQPAGTEMNFVGTMNFCSATVECGGGGGSGDVNAAPAGEAAYYAGPGTAAEVSGTSNLEFSGTTSQFPNGAVEVGASPPTACGTATACIATATSTGSVTPTSGQNTLRFSSSQVLCSINGGSESVCGGSGGGGNPTLDNCTPDQTGNSFYSVVYSGIAYLANWQFVPGTTTGIYCQVYIPTAATGATLVVDIWAADSTAGHTANFTSCDHVVNSGAVTVPALSCGPSQTFTTTSTANNRVTLTFSINSTLSNGSLLFLYLYTSAVGTQPSSNLVVYPHFIL